MKRLRVIDESTDLEIKLDNKIEEIRRSLLSAQRDLSEQDVVELERLERFIRLSRSLKPAKKLRGIRFLLLFLVGITIVLTALITKKTTIEVEADLTVSDVAYIQSKQQQVTDLWLLDRLGASSFSTLEMPSIPGAAKISIQNPPLRLEAAKGGITLAPFDVPRTTAVWILQRAGSDFAISLKGPPVDCDVTVRGPIRIVAGPDIRETDFGHPKNLHLRGGDIPLDLELSISDLNRANFSTPIEVEHLSFVRSQNQVIDGKIVNRQTSAVLRGEIYDESLNGRRYHARKGELIEFAEVKGEFRSIQLRSDGIHLEFHGWAKGLYVGSEHNKRSLMPSYLEFLKEKHGVTLLWVSIVWLITAIVGVAKWWNEL